MELYALYEIGVVRVEVKTVNINSEAFKKSFLGAQPPIMVENKFVSFLLSSFSTPQCVSMISSVFQLLEVRYCLVIHVSEMRLILTIVKSKDAFSI